MRSHHGRSGDLSPNLSIWDIRHDHITLVLQDLHWLPVESRIKFKILLLTFKCLNNLAPEYLSELLNIYHPARPLRSSNNLNLDVPPTRLKSYGDRSFSKASPILWNPLPFEIKSASSLQTFKNKLKQYLFKDSYWLVCYCLFYLFANGFS